MPSRVTNDKPFDSFHLPDEVFVKLLESLKRNLKQITKKTLPYSFEERLQKLKEVYRGWVSNFRLASIHAKLKKLDRKRKNLISLGIEQGQAYAWSRTNMGGWAVAQSPILRTTITLSRLRRKGYLSMLDYYSQTQSQIQ